MNKKLSILLFSVNFIVFFVGTGLTPILPLYAAEFGISSTGIGLYVAFIFGAITLGTIITSRIAYLFSTRQIFLATGLLGIPALVLLGRSNAFWQVVLLTALVWFLGGIGTALVNVQAGRHAAKDKRGKSFGLMFLALPVGLLLAGLTIGRLLEWQGFRFMFDALALLWAVWPVMALFGPNEKLKRQKMSQQATAVNGRHTFGLLFYTLVGTTLLSATTFYLTRLGTSISLSSLGFSPTEISSTNIVGGLVAIPATYLIGALSDRLSRKNIVILGYLFAVGATIIMSAAIELWHFWLAVGLLYMSRSINGSVTPALATDMIPKEQLGRGLPFLSAGNWVAGIFGSAIAGIGIENLGQTNLFLFAAGLAAAAVILLGLVSNWRQPTMAASFQPNG